MACLKCAMAPVIIINPGTSKWDIREKVWAYIESKNLANYPRPVFNRIPNFKGAFTACSRVSELDVFARAAEVKVDPDKPLEGARLAVLQVALWRKTTHPVSQHIMSYFQLSTGNSICLVYLTILVSHLFFTTRSSQAGKTLLVPTPRLRTGLFNKIIPPQGANKQQLHICASSQGVKLFSVPIELDAKLKVDLVVVGSVAVSEKGLRIGKGEGFADMEYGMMASMGALSDSTVVVTIVHDCQILDIPEELIESHDLTVDYILTPTRVIKTNCQRPKPQGIIWRKLSKEKLEKIPILRRLRAFEEKTLKDVSLGPTPIPAAPSLQTGSSMAGQKTTDRPEGESTEGARAQLGQKDRRQKRGWQRRGNRQKQGPEEGGQGQTEAGFRGRWTKQQTETGSRGRWPRPQTEAGFRGRWTRQQTEAGFRGRWTRQQTEAGFRGRWTKQQTEAGFRGRWPRPQTEAGSEEGGRGHRQKQGSEEGGRGNRQKQGPEEGGQSYRQKQGPEEGGQSYRQKQGPEEGGSEAVPLGATTVCLTALPSGLRVSELKRLLREQDAAPLKLTWLGAQQEAQLDYSNCQAAQRVLKVLQGLSLQAELSKGPQGEECSGWSH
ncbi:methenyltetrahydrofolate synthase domain-containing protein isoform X4 [Takifugu flavidus]|uniref:methenyltetrahydrofolate synthase domain-containing protein isoform X4 n=1 Tax=Takifugu flavidus TaxID=433684 RepID=UPI002544B808|nr:methenyltetrahydrofolate synthase domain-containing protein isoform X4 [Takifugu flavidus]